jgi:hypothetical protein
LRKAGSVIVQGIGVKSEDDEYSNAAVCHALLLTVVNVTEKTVASFLSVKYATIQLDAAGYSNNPGSRIIEDGNVKFYYIISGAFAKL